MLCLILAVSLLLVAENTSAQVLLNSGQPGTSFGSSVSGNSVVTNNIAIGNTASASNLASGIGKNVVSGIGSNFGGSGVSNFGAGGIGVNLANAGGLGVSALGGNTIAVPNIATNTLAVPNLSGNTLGVPNLAVNNFGGNALGGQGISFGSLSNVKFGEIEYIKDASVNSGYSGEYPVIGYVTFEGYLPASGTVSVANDGCGCT